MNKLILGTKDHKQNIIQYIYAIPASPSRVTHIYEANKGQLTYLIYDEEGLLMALETQVRL